MISANTKKHCSIVVAVFMFFFTGQSMSACAVSETVRASTLPAMIDPEGIDSGFNDLPNLSPYEKVALTIMENNFRSIPTPYKKQLSDFSAGLKTFCSRETTVPIRDHALDNQELKAISHRIDDRVHLSSIVSDISKKVHDQEIKGLLVMLDDKLRMTVVKKDKPHYREIIALGLGDRLLDLIYDLHMPHEQSLQDRLYECGYDIDLYEHFAGVLDLIYRIQRHQDRLPDESDRYNIQDLREEVERVIYYLGSNSLKIRIVSDYLSLDSGVTVNEYMFKYLPSLYEEYKIAQDEAFRFDDHVLRLLRPLEEMRRYITACFSMDPINTIENFDIFNIFQLYHQEGFDHLDREIIRIVVSGLYEDLESTFLTELGADSRGRTFHDISNPQGKLDYKSFFTMMSSKAVDSIRRQPRTSSLSLYKPITPEYVAQEIEDEIRTEIVRARTPFIKYQANKVPITDTLLYLLKTGKSDLERMLDLSGESMYIFSQMETAGQRKDYDLHRALNDRHSELQDVRDRICCADTKHEHSIIDLLARYDTPFKEEVEDDLNKAAQVSRDEFTIAWVGISNYFLRLKGAMTDEVAGKAIALLEELALEIVRTGKTSENVALDELMYLYINDCQRERVAASIQRVFSALARKNVNDALSYAEEGTIMSYMNNGGIKWLQEMIDMAQDTLVHYDDEFPFRRRIRGNPAILREKIETYTKAIDYLQRRMTEVKRPLELIVWKAAARHDPWALAADDRFLAFYNYDPGPAFQFLMRESLGIEVSDEEIARFTELTSDIKDIPVEYIVWFREVVKKDINSIDRNEFTQKKRSSALERLLLHPGSTIPELWSAAAGMNDLLMSVNTTKYPLYSLKMWAEPTSYEGTAEIYEDSISDWETFIDRLLRDDREDKAVGTHQNYLIKILRSYLSPEIVSVMKTKERACDDHAIREAVLKALNTATDEIIECYIDNSEFHRLDAASRADIKALECDGILVQRVRGWEVAKELSERERLRLEWAQAEIVARMAPDLIKKSPTDINPNRKRFYTAFKEAKMVFHAYPDQSRPLIENVVREQTGRMDGIWTVVRGLYDLHMIDGKGGDFALLDHIVAERGKEASDILSNFIMEGTRCHVFSPHTLSGLWNDEIFRRFIADNGVVLTAELYYDYYRIQTKIADPEKKDMLMSLLYRRVKEIRKTITTDRGYKEYKHLSYFRGMLFDVCRPAKIEERDVYYELFSEFDDNGPSESIPADLKYTNITVPYIESNAKDEKIKIDMVMLDKGSALIPALALNSGLCMRDDRVFLRNKNMISISGLENGRSTLAVFMNNISYKGKKYILISTIQPSLDLERKADMDELYQEIARLAWKINKRMGFSGVCVAADNNIMSNSKYVHRAVWKKGFTVVKNLDPDEVVAYASHYQIRNVGFLPDPDEENVQALHAA